MELLELVRNKGKYGGAAKLGKNGGAIGVNELLAAEFNES